MIFSSSRPGFWHDLFCLSQLLIKFASTDRRYQRIDDQRKLVERRHYNRRFSLLELNWLQPAPNEQRVRAIWVLSPPQRHSLLLFDGSSHAVLLHPIARGSGVVRIFQDQLLLFETRLHLDHMLVTASDLGTTRSNHTSGYLAGDRNGPIPSRRLNDVHQRHLTDLRHPAASGSSGVQNHRLPPPLSIFIRA